MAPTYFKENLWERVFWWNAYPWVADEATELPDTHMWETRDPGCGVYFL